MHTLSQLRAGKLTGIQRLTLSENISTFPLEILCLADSLEVLDLSNNQLSSLPPEISQLHKLKIIFASNNDFDTLPVALGQCPNLEMVGFKSNKIRHVPERALPPKLRWLILTDNQIETLPNSLGERPRLQKLALAGNQLTKLPKNLGNLKQLELIRISANLLSKFPEQLFKLPKLAWLAFAGNPFTQMNESGQHLNQETESNTDSVSEIPSTSFTIGTLLGQGASGVISKATWNTPQYDYLQNQYSNNIAVKVFKGEMTSDGYPQDELNACLIAGHHENLVKPLAQVNESGYLALMMELIPAHYGNLGLPPSLQSCTRDTFPDGFSLSADKVKKIVTQMQNVFDHLHNKHICHGDLYAHNTLFDQDANIIFGDFGAASLYHMLNKEQQEKIKKIEQRALDYFIEDLMSVCKNEC